MLIKTTHDTDINKTHYFVGFSDDDDTDHDHAVTQIYYRTWAMNTGTIMLNLMMSNKPMVMAR